MGVTCNDIKSSRKMFEHIDVPDVFIDITQFLSVLFLVYCRLNFILKSNQQYILMYHFLFLVFLVYDHHIKKIS